MAGVTCRSSEMSSSTQMPRPCVATSRSLPFTSRSRTEVFGRLFASDCHVSPSSNDTYTLLSVPANSRPRVTGSGRTTRARLPLGSSTGRPAMIFTQVRPKSRVRYRYGAWSPLKAYSTAA